MIVIDCSNTLNFFQEIQRMCDCINECTQCKIDLSVCPIRSGGKAELNPKKVENMITVIQQWSNTHPRKTYFDDFKEKFPLVSDDDIYQRYCVNDLYKRQQVCTDINFSKCVECWNTPLEEAEVE